METSEFDGFGCFLYHYAAKFAKNRKILEIGCGTGQGAYILSLHTSKGVTGIDRSRKAIKRALKNKRYNLHFKSFDILDLDKLRVKFGLITMFNTLEHFTKEEQIKILQNISNLLKKDGLCFLCTNNKSLATVKNPFHKNELTNYEFSELVKKFFRADFFGLKQSFNPQFKREGKKNKFVNFVFKNAFIQEKVQPLIPKKIRNFANTVFLHLPPSVESDFSLSKDLANCENMLAICKKVLVI